MASPLAEVRALVPMRPLTLSESLHLAELQAQCLLATLEIVTPPVPDRAITELPRVQVTREFNLPISGASHWTTGGWLIVLNADEPVVRQRFTMAHELKHVLDAPASPALLYPAVRHLDSAQRTEQICDFFAACLLMPRPWIKEAWRARRQDPADLARRFAVSGMAMRRRLIALGLVDPTPRCLAG